MSGYPGNYPGNHHHQQQQNYGGQGGFPQPQPNYGGGGYPAPGGPPPFPSPNGGYGPPQGFPQPSYSPQPPYGGQGGFPSPGAYQQNNYQQGGGGGGFPHPSTQQQYAPPPGMPNPTFNAPSGPPPMQYNQPNLPPPSRIGPPQYQGGNFPVHTAPQGQTGQFVYSNCSGKRKALSIGINYTGTSNALRGCINDSQTKFLCERYNFKQDDIVILTDSPNAGQRQVPTKANIIAAMQWLVRDARPNDSLFFHYSGHGGQTKDIDGDEDDGFDETIYPLDFKQSGQIVDDEMHNIMVRQLPQGCRLTAIFDSCHSGSALDLPYIYSTQGKLKGPNLLADAGSGAMGAVQSYMKGDLGGAISSLTGLGKKLMNQNSGAAQRTKQEKSSTADVISWSGCKDEQTSADTNEAGKATGAMSWAFIAALTKYPQQSYLQLLNTIRDELKGRYDQRPQLSSAHEMDVNLLFVI